MSETFYKKSERIKENFRFLKTEDRYLALIEMGKKLPPLSSDKKTPDRIVSGCQSILYLYSEFKEGKVYFQAAADALISAGLASLLIEVYSGELPETILKVPPVFLKDLGLETSLSPSRSNGLYQIHLRMKQEALKYLLGR